MRVMGEEYHAVLMRNLDEPVRDALIAQADNVIDCRHAFEREALNNVTVSMPHPYFDGDDIA
jgi:hypothetical protein